MFYYFNAEMKYYEKPIPTFANATDEELADMLAKHYANEIDLSTIKGWEVGATRLIHLDAMQAPSPNSSNTWAAQDITVVIVAHDHTDLATSINGHNKACITVQTKEVLNNCAVAYNDAGHIYVNGDSSIDTSFTKWSNLYMRIFLNSNVYNAFQSDFKSMIKASKHYRHTEYDTSTSEQVTDNIFLPSYPEVFGTASDDYYVATSPTEGTQFEYYASDDTTRKIKYGNNNGVANGTAQYWWNGSASSDYYSDYGHCWCDVTADGDANRNFGGNALGLAPAFAM